jgi:streptothricin acetyltransferase
MKIGITPLSRGNFNDLNRCDGSFQVDSRLDLFAERGLIQYTVIKIPPYTKRFPIEELDYTDYLENPHKAAYLAYVDGQLAGQIILRKYWNNYAYVDDIVVDIHCRRQGVGRALIAQAVEWAKTAGLPGIMLEAQNNNLAACRFYERCGFQLAGFDRLLYKGITPDTDEIALYWYLLF